MSLILLRCRQSYSSCSHQSIIRKICKLKITNSRIAQPSVLFSSTTASTNKKFNRSTNSQTALYSLIGGFCVTVLGGTSYLHNHVGGTESLFRTVSFYSLAIPRYVMYRYHMNANSSDETWEQLHKDTAEVGLDKMLELRGFYIKSGQMVAANIGDGFPKIWQDKFSILQDDVPPEDFATVKAVIESELGGKLEDYFEKFDEIPIGAASIGQVHRAVLKNGEKVVVKIQYPKVESLFRGDVRTIKMFAQLAQPVHVPALNEVEKGFLGEFDYKKESRQMDAIRVNLIQGGWSPDVCRVPKPYLDLCTKKVLVMEELQGEKLAVELKRNIEKFQSKTGISIDLHEKPPTAEELDTYISLLEANRKYTNIKHAFYNKCISWWLPGAKKQEFEDASFIPYNIGDIMDQLLLIHGHEVLVDGYFNGDPHPGNILLLPPKNNQRKPTIGLIDYGQIKQLSKESRLLLCKIIIALDDDDRDQIIDLMKQAGYKSKYMDPEVIYKYAKVSYDEDNPELTNNLHIQMFMEELQRIDPIENLPQDYIVVGRASILLRGLGHALGQRRSVARAWRGIAEKVLKDEDGDGI